MAKTIGYLCRSLHAHLTAEGIVVDGLPDAVVAADHHPRTAEMVGDVVVPTGRSAIGIQVHIAAVELPQQRRNGAVSIVRHRLVEAALST